MQIFEAQDHELGARDLERERGKRVDDPRATPVGGELLERVVFCRDAQRVFEGRRQLLGVQACLLEGHGQAASFARALAARVQTEPTAKQRKQRGEG